MEHRNGWKKIGAGVSIVILMPLVLFHLWNLLELLRGSNQILNYIKGSFLFDNFAIMKFGILETIIYSTLLFGAKIDEDELGAALILGCSLFVGWFSYIPKHDIFQQDIALFGAFIALIGVSLGLNKEKEL